MLNVKLSFKTLDLEQTLAQKKAIYASTSTKALVASTKSYNNLIDDLKQEGKAPTQTEIKELFLDKAEVSKAISPVISAAVPDAEVAVLVLAHCMKALDAACVFRKPPVKRK